MKTPIERFFRQELTLHTLSINILAIILNLTFLMPSFAKETYDDCKINKVESHIMYEYLDHTANKLDALNSVHKNLCSVVKDNELQVEMGNFIQNTFILRWGACRGREVNPQFSKKLRDEGSAKPVYRVFEAYCRDKWPYYTTKDVTWEDNIIDSAFWLRQELLCQKMRYISYSDSWFEVLRPKDFDSVKLLEKSASSICDDLRNKKINYVEAKYRWETELQWFDDHIEKEAVQHYGKQLMEPVQKILETILGN